MIASLLQIFFHSLDLPRISEEIRPLFALGWRLSSSRFLCSGILQSDSFTGSLHTSSSSATSPSPVSSAIFFSTSAFKPSATLLKPSSSPCRSLNQHHVSQVELEIVEVVSLAIKKRHSPDLVQAPLLGINRGTSTS